MWAENIKDGRRPDFLVLLALNALLETHAMVHLADSKIWTTMNDPPEEHEQLLECCEYHLVFLGRGNFIEMVARDRPLVIIEESEDVKTLEIGRLTFNESSTLDSAIQRGLGVGIDPDASKLTRPECTSEIKKEICEPEPGSQGSLDPTTETSDQLTSRLSEYQKEFGIKNCSVMITRIDADQTKKPVDIEKRVSEERRDNSDSEDTIIYSLGNIIKTKSNSETVAKRHISGHPSKTGFHISMHGIRKKKKRTYLSCKIVGCKSWFSCIHDWNSHHR